MGSGIKRFLSKFLILSEYILSSGQMTDALMMPTFDAL